MTTTLTPADSGVALLGLGKLPVCGAHGVRGRRWCDGGVGARGDGGRRPIVVDLAAMMEGRKILGQLAGDFEGPVHDPVVLTRYPRHLSPAVPPMILNASPNGKAEAQ